ncbi:MAG TPA: squalene synthase HpnC [Elusimicrobia bacterium]|nr:squalene synthase HpnC [Elusimicrobiota bacterium]
MNETMSWADATIADARDLSEADAFCARLVDDSRGRSPMPPLPGALPLRPHIAAIFAFARIAVDFANDSEFAPDRLGRLADWERQLRAAESGQATHPVFAALGRTIRERGLPLGPFEDLLGAARQDCAQKRYQTFAELQEYCRRSANPLGRLALMVDGVRDTRRLEFSDRVCTALRLTRVLQEIQGDLDRDRIYIPREDFQATGYSEADLRMKIVNERFRSLMKIQWKRARTLYEEGKPLFLTLPRPLSWELKLTWLGGKALLRKVHKLGYDTLRHRPALTRWDWPNLLLGVLFS